jgi:hypothetical protein
MLHHASSEHDALSAALPDEPGQVYRRVDAYRPELATGRNSSGELVVPKFAMVVEECLVSGIFHE